jgi:hypothetical protein
MPHPPKIGSILAESVNKRQPLPDFADIIFILILMLLVNLLPDYVLGDGSTGWHLYTGQYILTHGQIPHSDLFSYTFPNRAWVPYEWLFDLCAAGLYRLGGIKLVAIATDCLLALLFSLVYHECRKEKCHFLLAMLLTVLGILTSTIHWLARPHLFTFFGILIFSRTLEAFRRGDISSRRLVLTLAITMVIWANAHPAFLIGLGLVGIYYGCETFIALLSGDAELKAAAWRRSNWLGIGLLASIAASFINANGFQLYAYIFQYLHHSDVIAKTNEFMPPNFHDLHAVCLALLFFAFVVGLFLTRKRIGLSPLMMVLALAWLSINSMRNEPLFAIAAVPIIASLYSDCDPSAIFNGASFATSSWVNKIANVWRHFGNVVDEVETHCNLHILPLVATLVLVIACCAGGKLFGMELVSADFDPEKKPTTTLLAMEKLPEKGGFNLDNWGGYIAFKTNRRVFIDDRLDFYGHDFFMDYGNIISLTGNWHGLLDKYKINWILLPKESTLLGVLKNTGDWSVDTKDKAAVLLVRKHFI